MSLKTQFCGLFHRRSENQTVTFFLHELISLSCHVPFRRYVCFGARLLMFSAKRMKLMSIKILTAHLISLSGCSRAETATCRVSSSDITQLFRHKPSVIVFFVVYVIGLLIHDALSPKTLKKSSCQTNAKCPTALFPAFLELTEQEIIQSEAGQAKLAHVRFERKDGFKVSRSSWNEISLMSTHTRAPSDEIDHSFLRKSRPLCSAVSRLVLKTTTASLFSGPGMIVEHTITTSE